MKLQATVKTTFYLVGFVGLVDLVFQVATHGQIRVIHTVLDFLLGK